jgi:hypothetical protein
MFWNKKRPLEVQPKGNMSAPAAQQKPLAEQLNEAAEALSSSLSAYSEAAYRASKSVPDAELIEARAKVEAARKLVLDGRMAYVLGRCIPEHVKYWPSWNKRDDFRTYVHFNANNIESDQHEEVDGSRTVKIVTIIFTFNESRYRLVLRDRGMSYVPDAFERVGEIELWLRDEIVAKFELIEDLAKDYSQWEYSDVLALRAGPWMKDMIDIATQIESGGRKWLEDLHNNRTLEAAKNIEF